MRSRIISSLLLLTLLMTGLNYEVFAQHKKEKASSPAWRWILLRPWKVLSRTCTEGSRLSICNHTIAAKTASLSVTAKTTKAAPSPTPAITPSSAVTSPPLGVS